MKAVVYYRSVPDSNNKYKSRKREGQKAQADEFVEVNGFEVVGTYTEFENRRGKEGRPKLNEAVKQCQAEGAILVIAVIGRLDLSLKWMSFLSEAGVDFVCVDRPEINSDMVADHVEYLDGYWADSRAKASESLTEAYKEGRAVLSGCVVDVDLDKSMANLNRAHEVVKERARDHYSNVLPVIAEMRQKENPVSWEKIAERLNQLGYTTVAGGKIHSSTAYYAWHKYSD